MSVNLTIWSGGQTGVDQAALRAAKRLGIKTGGYAPKWWLTEVGPAPWLGTEYGLAECAENGYPARTKANVQYSSITIWVGPMGSRGYHATARAIRETGGRLVCGVHDLERGAENLVPILTCGIDGVDGFIANIAGSRESANPGIGGLAEAFLFDVLQRTLRAVRS